MIKSTTDKWPTAGEIAAALGVLKRAIQRRATKEAWSYEEESCNGGRRRRFDPAALPKDVRRQLKNHRLEQQIKPINPPTRPADSADPDLSTLNLPVPLNLLPAARPAAITITEAQKAKALAKADLLKLYNRAIAMAPWGRQTAARDEFIANYNAGLAWPTLFGQIGQVHWKTIEGWKQRLKSSRNDAFILADTRGACRKGTHSVLAPNHTEILLAHALVPGKRRISEAIRLTRATLTAQRVPCQVSDVTFYRWLEEWKSRNFDLWVLIREGHKAWSEQCEPYIICDYSKMQVGDALVADGHPLNFRIINPWTGKAQNHMTLLLFSDMLSTKPLGWEIMPTENTEAIHSALRRSIIALGKIPQKAYLDNGRAFRGQHFKGSRNFDEEGFEGLYARLGIGVSHAIPYNAKAKPIERFFESFGELERLLYPVYTGTSIENKPPRMHRNEKMHREVHAKVFGEDCAITMEQAHMAVAMWFDEYSNRPSRSEHLNGATPQEVFLAGRGPGVDPEQLAFLMMKIENKQIRRAQITHRGKIFRHDALYGQDRKATIRYDLQDETNILVYNPDGSFLCSAPLATKVDRMASLLGDEAEAVLSGEMGNKRALEKQTTTTARAILEQHVLNEHRRQLATIGAMQALPPGESATKTSKTEEIAPKLTQEEFQNQVEEVTLLNRRMEAEQLVSRLEQMDEFGLYEYWLDQEMQGIELPSEARRFMLTYEQTAPKRDLDYFEGQRVTLALMYGKKEKAAGQAAAGATKPQNQEV